MKLRVAVYNMEWMVNLFTRDGEPKTTGEDGERSGRLADVVKAVDPDILGIVEGPDTTVSGNKLASAQLEAWAAHHGLHVLNKSLNVTAKSSSPSVYRYVNVVINGWKIIRICTSLSWAISMMDSGWIIMNSVSVAVRLRHCSATSGSRTKF